MPQLNVDIYPGQYLVFDENEGAFMPDFLINVFMKLGTKEVVYDEGYTSFGAAVHNYSRIENEQIVVNKLIFKLQP